MKKLGLVGGVAWPSTIDYYRAICRLSIEHHRGRHVSGPPPVPEMSIESLNLNKSFSLRGGDVLDHESWSQYDKYFRDALRRIEVSGAEIAIIASNTPHNRFDAITRGIGIPVLSIFEAVASHCKGLGVEEMLILGTAPTMESSVFPQILKRYGITGSAPTRPEDRAQVVTLIGELYTDNDDRAAQRIGDVVKASLPARGVARTACLACTELPLAFREIERVTELSFDGTLYINTTMVHAKAVFAELIRD